MRHTLPSLFEAAADAGGAQPAVFVDGGYRSWAQWRAEAHALARGLQDLGIGQGDVVAVHLPNCWEFLTVHVAVAAAGATMLPLHMGLGANELRSLLARTRAATLVGTADRMHGLLAELRAGSPALRHVLVVGDADFAPNDVLALEDMARRWAGTTPLPVQVGPDDPFVLLPSSGTTSLRQKICVHTHDALISNAVAVAADGRARGTDTIISASLFTHLFGLLSVHVSLVTRGRQALLRGWDVRELLRLAAASKAGVLYAVPAQIRDIVSQLGASGDDGGIRLTEVRASGAAIPATLVEDARRLLGARVISHWGMSEVGAGLYTRPDDPLNAATSGVGRPVSGGQVRVVDEGGNPCGTGETGELQFRGPSMFTEYFEEPELTRNALTVDGWLRTGDRAVLNEDGTVAFRGRDAEVINVGGVKFSASEIEMLLDDLPGPRLLAVVGRPDDRLGEYPCLVVTLRAGAALTLREVTAHLAAKGVAEYKIPAELIVQEEIPCTPTGKIARRRLAAMLDGDVSRAQSVWVRRMLALPPSERLRHALDLVREQVRVVLGDPGSIGPDQVFTDFGMKSLTAVRLRAAVSEATGFALPATTAYDLPTPNLLARHLCELLVEKSPVGTPATSNHARPAAQDPVVVVGMGCRLPGDTTSPDEFWELLVAGRETLAEFPSDRGWVFDPDATFTRRGSFLRDAAWFDPAFFGISPREAMTMDPQQRLLLETTWEALEHAGIDPNSLRDTETGVFVGAMASDYLPRTYESVTNSDVGAMTGNAGGVASGRISYVLGLRGPALTVDTACSSSLVALHLAARSLRAGECSMALVGGATVMSTQATFAEFARQGALAADGRCKSFAAAADGTGWGEAVGVLVLERLSDARRAGHRVLGVIRGSAVNSDGTSNGLTAPNGHAQQRVIRRALADAELDPSDVDAVEAHGTGTTLGDPIEAQAILATYGQDRERPLLLGSMKSNLGHAQAAAGIVGTIKMILAMRNGLVPKTLHVDEPSPHVDWAAGAVRLVIDAAPWPETGRPRRAGVSAFGISGTNAHVILEQAPSERDGQGRDGAEGDGPGWGGAEGDGPGGSDTGQRGTGRGDRDLSGAGQREPDSDSTGQGATGRDDRGHHGIERDSRTDDRFACPPKPVVPLVFSASTTAALAALAGRLDALLSAGAVPTDVGYSLTTTRATFEHRAVVLDADRDDLAALMSGIPGPAVTGHADLSGGAVFVFPGHGAQWAGMGAELLGSAPVFAAAMAECEDVLSEFVDWSLTEVIADESALRRTEVVQPVLFAVTVSLARLWQHHGVEPAAVIGHSQGEIAAAHIAGVLSLRDAIRAVVRRGELCTELSGMMLSVGSVEDVENYLAAYPAVSIAARNSLSSTVLAGDAESLTALAKDYRDAGKPAHVVPIGYASHSAYVEPIRDRLLADLAELSPQQAHIPWYSTVTGQPMTGRDADAGYWYDNLRRPVQFAATVESLAAAGFNHFIEVGPHPVLTTAMQETVGEGGLAVGTLRRGHGGLRRFAGSLAQAYVRGLPVDWTRFFDGSDARRIDLPTYPFQRGHYWVGRTRQSSAAGLGQQDITHPLVAALVEHPGRQGVTCTGLISLAEQPWLTDHRVHGAVVVPGTALVELAVHLGQRFGCHRVDELVMPAPLVVPEDGSVRLQVRMTEEEDKRVVVAVHSRITGQESWTEHLTGALVPETDTAVSGFGSATWPPQGAQRIDVDTVYESLVEAGVAHGPAFRGLGALWRRDTELFAEVLLPEDLSTGSFLLHPALLDAALHPIAVTQDHTDTAVQWPGAGAARGPGDPAPGPRPMLPFAWRGVSLFATGATALRVRLRPEADRQGGIALDIADDLGRPVARVESLICRRTDGMPPGSAIAPNTLFRIGWKHAGQRSGDDRELLDVSAVPDLRTALNLVLTALQRKVVEQAGLLVLTRNAVATADFEDTDPVQAAVWGLVRSAQREHPGLFVLADTDDPAAFERAVPVGENEFAVRADSVLVPRLIRQRAVRTQMAANAGGAALVTGIALVTDDAALVTGGAALATGGAALVTDGAALVTGGAVPATGGAALVVSNRALLPDGAAFVTDDALLTTDGTVLVTGGTGGLGRRMARHLAERHRVRHLLLISRSGSDAPGAQALRAELADLGADVRIVACDVGDRAALAEVVAGIDPQHPLTGVVHAAGIVDDGVLGALNADRIEKVLWSKADAARHLHELTQDLPVRVFVLFSSIAGLLGSPGQANYGAANAYLDGLAAHRRARGLPAVSVAWGLWPQATGMTSTLTPADHARMSRNGILALSDADGLALFDAALTAGPALLAAMHVDLAAIGSTPTAPIWRELVRPVPESSVPATGSVATAATPSDSLRRQLTGLDTADQVRLIEDLVRGRVAALLGYRNASAVALDRKFLEIGFDSLSAKELHDAVNKATGLRLPLMAVFDAETPGVLAMRVWNELIGPPRTAETEPVATVSRYEESVRAVVQHAVAAGNPDAAFSVMRAAADLRTSFTDSADRGPLPAATTLTDGPHRTRLIALSSPMANGGVHQHARLAAHFRDAVRFSAVPLPGFASGEKLPASAEAALTAVVDGVLGAAADEPFVLLGYSSGGALAYAAARRLERSPEARLAALVMIDTFPIDDPAVPIETILREMFVEETGIAGPTGDRLSAMGRWLAVMSGMDFAPVEVPVLFVRATEPFAPGAGDPARWQTRPFHDTHDLRAVRSDHFGLVGRDSEHTAQVVREWLDERL
ncbi:SDR family NAD(P)-dependent oxidoreductase [Nocardia sp. CWNU-33]|uniref:SDR family NAD(P)-dependent oxidoreductase n=1 Tax=Nocardia sp. CWNU-33 TaxID=3392117 RepID=UPI00398E80DD